MMHMINYEVVHIVVSLILVRRILTFVISYTLYDTLEYMKYKKLHLSSIIFYVYEKELNNHFRPIL